MTDGFVDHQTMTVGVLFTPDALVLPVGLIILALVGVRLGILIADAYRQMQHRRQRDELQLDLLRVNITKAKNQRSEDSLAWNGFRKFKVAQRVDEAQGVCSFTLKPHDGKPLPSFKPGQYLTFRLNVPGREKPVIRCYSLSDRPRNDQYRVSIKRVDSPKDAPSAPPGLVSNFFHEQIREGEIVDVQAPRGQFFLDMEQERPCVLIAGGVGVTPLLSMVNRIADSGNGREVLLFYGVRNGSEHAFRETLEDTVENHANVRMVVAYSQPRQDDQNLEGHAYHHAGWIDIDLIKQYLNSTNYDFYVCGPPAMMESVTQQLLKWGVASGSIKTEAFGPATVSKSNAKPKPALNQPVDSHKGESKATGTQAASTTLATVEFSKSGLKCPWEPDATNLLELADANGVQIDSGCRAGNCGTCAVAIKAGKVMYLVDHGADLEDGTCLACIAAPDGDIVLDA